MKYCSKCGKENKSSHKEICHKCYLETYNTPIDKCSQCGEITNVFNRNPVLCRKCYMKNYNAPKKICSKCGEEREIKSKGICNKCYMKEYNQPEKICASCKKKKKLATDKCYSCRNKERMENDIEFAIRTRLRKRVSKFVRSGSIRKSLIEYDKIIEYLGELPGDNYHIDHIFPLKAFDLTKEDHIRAAFAPENHRWLPDRENMAKKDSYDKIKFAEYIKKFL